VSGVLNAATVVTLLRESHKSFVGVSRMEVDLGAVTESDSAGLALLLEWLRVGREAKQQVHYTNIPGQISALARISEVDDLLTANGTSAPAEVAAQTSEQSPVTAKTQMA
jgi:phospholipid transport system transporter-binding protein